MAVKLTECCAIPNLGAWSRAATVNPKDLLGSKKVPLSQVLPIAMAHEAMAMADGSRRYGFRNWRAKKVLAHIYIDAAMRHIEAWAEGEEIAGIGQLVQKSVEVRRHQQDRSQHDADAEQQKGDGENPPGVRHHAG